MVLSRGELKRMGHNVDFVTNSRSKVITTHYLPLLASDGVQAHGAAQREVGEQETLAVAIHARARYRGERASMETHRPTAAHLVELFERPEAQGGLCPTRLCNLIAATAGFIGIGPQVVLSFRNYNPSHFSYLANDWFHPLSRCFPNRECLLTGNSRRANADYARWIGVDESRVKLVPNALDSEALPPRRHESVRECGNSWGGI